MKNLYLPNQKTALEIVSHCVIFSMSFPRMWESYAFNSEACFNPSKNELVFSAKARDLPIIIGMTG